MNHESGGKAGALQSGDEQRLNFGTETRSKEAQLVHLLMSYEDSNRD